MDITKAFASVQNGYPALELEIDGHLAWVEEPKHTLLDAGIVVLLDSDGYWAMACRRTPKVYQAKNGLEDSKCTTFEGENGSI